MVDLPPPVGPTSAMVSPRLTFRVKSFSTGLSVLVVEVDMVELDVAAACVPGSKASGRSATSGTASTSEKMRSAEAMACCISAKMRARSWIGHIMKVT